MKGGVVMNCSLNKVVGLILTAIGLLLGAIALAVFWIAAAPLYVAAGLVATVVFALIPAIKNALLEYAACRGRSDKCSISSAVDSLGVIGLYLSAGTFLAAALLETAALAAYATILLGWLGVSLQGAAAVLVASGTTGCVITIFVLIGAISKATGFRDCMDAQGGGTSGGPASGGAIA
jgi:hypothetical protein